MKKIIIILFLLIVKIIFPQSDSFILSTHNFQPYFPTYIGNGYFSLSSSSIGTLPTESYMIKVYDEGKDDIPRIACLPEWNEINYFNGINWLNDFKLNDTLYIKNYTQTLDMYNGFLETSYNWIFDNKKSDINVLAFISRKNPNLVVIKFDLTTNFSDTIILSFPIKEREKPLRMALAKLEKIEPNPPGKWPAEWYPGFTEIINIETNTDIRNGEIFSLSQTEGRNTKVALATEVFYDGEIPNSEISMNKNENSANIEIKFITEQNRKYSFYKFVSIVSEKDFNGDLQNFAKEIVQNAKITGFEKLLEEHKNVWNNLWQTDIIVNGDDEFQKIIHSMIYYLLCSINEETEFSIPPMGLATSGYYGHIFWDADTYMFPALLLMYPEKAKSMVMFRYRTLNAAKENARKNNYKGAMYPWESDERGEETTPFFAYQNALQENHIVGDVALAQWQYFLATKDTNWLSEYGSKVITETAEFWTSKVNYNKEKDRYEIGKIVSVHEGLIDISNDTYTNSIAKLNLEIASKVNNILNERKNPKWKEISDKMFIPFDSLNQFHPTFENAPEETKGTVVPLLTFPLQIQMDSIIKKNNLLNAVEHLEKNGAGAMMGTNFLPIVAAELNNDSLFNYLINKTLKGYLRPPFNVLAETHTNNSVNFITGAGAFLQQVIFGYTGLRLTNDGLIQKYNSMLPENITSLLLKNFTINNKKFDILVEGKELKFIDKSQN